MKKKKRCGSGKTMKKKKRCSQGDGRFLPEEILFEMLARLPVKSLCRFRCVSPLWRSIISDPDFVSSHFARSYARPKLLFSLYDHEDHHTSGKIFLSADYPENSDHWRQVPSYHCKITCRRYTTPGSVGGLICNDEAADGIQIFNPATGEFITLRRPFDDSGRSFFGYDPVEKKYKIVNSMGRKGLGRKRLGTENHILTLGEKEWRRIDPGVPSLRVRDTLCVEGVLHMVGEAKGGKPCIVLFDVRLETFRVIPFPGKLEYHVRLIELGGCAAVLGYSPAILRGCVEFRLWILEDHRNETWRCEEFIRSPHLVETLRVTPHDIVGFTHAGELVFAPWRSLEPSYFYLYNLENGSLRKIEICGLGEGKLAQTCGYNGLAMVCHHVESLQSLRDFRID